MELDGRTAIITGGGTGIGRGIALRLAQAGCRLVLTGRRASPLKATVETIASQGGIAEAVQGDVSKDSDVEQIVKTTLEQNGAIDILVNNAAISGGGPIHSHDIAVWDQTMAVNLRGPFLMARAVLPYMRAQERGHIINISSEAGLEYYSSSGAYGVSKHALNALGEFIQRENQDQGIRVDTICPGMVVTEMTENAPGLNFEKCLYPEDIADLVYWLLSRRRNIKIGTPTLIQTMENPWEN